VNSTKAADEVLIMTVAIERKADFHILLFSAELNIFTVRDDLDSLKTLAEEVISQLIIDVSAVQDFDSAGLQLLLYLQFRLQAEQSTNWIGLDNPVISKVQALFGLDRISAMAET